MVHTNIHGYIYTQHVHTDKHMVTDKNAVYVIHLDSGHWKNECFTMDDGMITPHLSSNGTST